MRTRSTRRRSRVALSEISLTPLIDTALTLLIIFMVATPVMHNSIKINLPSGNAKEAVAQTQDLIVYITKEHQMFFNGVPVNDENLIRTIQSALRPGDSRPVFVRGDTDAVYGKIVEVVNKIKTVGGIEYVALATKKS